MIDFFITFCNKINNGLCLQFFKPFNQNINLNTTYKSSYTFPISFNSYPEIILGFQGWLDDHARIYTRHTTDAVFEVRGGYNDPHNVTLYALAIGY